MTQKGIAKLRLITNQQLKIVRLKGQQEKVRPLVKRAIGKFIAIGQPLNDNVLQFNNKQLVWCSELLETLREIEEVVK